MMIVSIDAKVKNTQSKHYLQVRTHKGIHPAKVSADALAFCVATKAAG